MSNPAQVIRPPNTLRMKVGGSFGGIDAGAIAKAEQALQAMSSQFGQWLQDELEKLDSARAADRRSQVGSGDRSERIRTYNFPQGRVTDHRINLTLYKLPQVIEGGALDELIDALTIEHQAELLAAQEFDEDAPVIRVSALKALEGDPKWVKSVEDLMDAVDED